MKLKQLYNELRNLYSMRIEFEFISDTDEIAYVHRKSVRHYIVYVNSKYKDDVKIVGSLFKHELGHIKFLHLDNVERDMIKLREFIKKTPDLIERFKKLTNYIKSKLMMACYNIINDFEINSKLLTQKERDYLEENELHPAMPSDYNLPGGLEDEEYFYPVFKKLLDEYDKYESDKDKLEEFIKFLLSKIFSMDANDLNLSSEETEDEEDQSDDTDESDKKIVTVLQVADSTLENESDEEKLPKFKLLKGDKLSGSDIDNIVSDSDNNQEDLPIIKPNDDPVKWQGHKVIFRRRDLLVDYLKKVVFTYKLEYDRQPDPTYRMKKGKSDYLTYELVLRRVIKQVRCYYVVVDISGSMDDEVVKEVLECIKYMRDRGLIDRRSLIVYCNERVEQIIDMKGDLYAPPTGGGTCLYRAINAKYMPNYIDKIVLVTDLGENYGPQNLIEVVNSVHKETFCILYGCTEEDKETALKICKKESNFRIF